MSFSVSIKVRYHVAEAHLIVVGRNDSMCIVTHVVQKVFPALRISGVVRQWSALLRLVAMDHMSFGAIVVYCLLCYCSTFSCELSRGKYTVAFLTGFLRCDGLDRERLVLMLESLSQHYSAHVGQKDESMTLTPCSE